MTEIEDLYYLFLDLKINFKKFIVFLGLFPKGKGPKKGAKKGKRKPPPPPPKEFVGERPTWQSVSQKGKVCVGTSSAAVPCKDPIKIGAKCDEKFQWSTDGYIQSIVHCKKNPKGGVIRKELRQECNMDSGVLMVRNQHETNAISVLVLATLVHNRLS
jgi:hypothetical protein